MLKNFINSLELAKKQIKSPLFMMNNRKRSSYFTKESGKMSFKDAIYFILKGLKKTLFTRPAQWVFEMKIQECTDDRLSIDFHYCPLVKAWQKQGCTDDQITRLCDIAMCGDRGIAERFGCEMDLPKAIARGDNICQVRFRRRASG